MNILKYNLLSPYSVICVYVFRDDHLVLESQLVCSSSRRAASPISSSTQLPVAAYVGLRPWEVYPHAVWHVYCVLLVQLVVGHAGETLQEQILMLLGDTNLQQSL